MSRNMRSRPLFVALTSALLGVLVLGAVAVFASSSQAESAVQAFVQAQSQAAVAAEALEDGQESTRLAEDRLDSARQAAQQKALEFADARFYCDATGNAIVFDDVRWCDVSAQRLSELEDAERDLARLSTELQISEDELPKLEADVEATLDEETISGAAAEGAETLQDSLLISWMVLSGLLATATLIEFFWRRPELSSRAEEGEAK